MSQDRIRREYGKRDERKKDDECERPLAITIQDPINSGLSRLSGPS